MIPFDHESHKRMWNLISLDGPALTRQMVLMRMGFNPREITNQCFACHYVYQNNFVMKDSHGYTELDCSKCPLDWSPDSVCTTLLCQWEEVYDVDTHRSIARQIRDTPLK